MRRIGIILVFCMLWAPGGFAASRTSVTPVNNSVGIRTGTVNQKVRTSTNPDKKTTRISAKKTISRTATATQPNTNTRNTTSARVATTTARTGNVVARAATETRTGTEYENCKNAYFTCMDQFCQLKSDDFRRCSCSDRITKLQSAKNSLNDAREQLIAFNENLDIVGKTAAQASAMNTASDGENALTRDNSASKALLNAIMNSIRGDNTRVENSQLSDLNSVDLSFDSANSFGTNDVGQTIASYNGTALYSAVYPQCRNAVKSTCNTASLQRAVNAYLMAIEQDCNTVQTAIQNKQKETHAAIRESSAMLDMARAENHQKHNSDDIATCIANVESAILSEEVCGANYHKCLDNGEYIDVTTGAPIAGVVDFYKLGQMLTFNTDRNNANQNLAQNPANRTFVNTFEKRVKQFAEPALDKCYDDSKTVWNDYLNKAMLDIYYAQQSKVDEIKQGCFDFVSACYMNGSTAMTNAMQGLIATQTTTLKPDILKLNQSLCSDYIASCNNMFDGKIIESYIDNRHETDSLTACRAVVKQCFDNYGGLNYENFYNPYSGLFKTGHAPDWFSLYERDSTNKVKCNDDHFYEISNTNTDPCSTHGGYAYKSECANQLAGIEACSAHQIIEKAFGGFDYYKSDEDSAYHRYGYKNNDRNGRQDRLLRSTGVATEIYNQIIDILQTQCSTLDGKFMSVQNLALYSDNYSPDNFCETTFHNESSRYYAFHESYSIGKTYTSWDRRNNLIFKDTNGPRIPAVTPNSLSSSSNSATPNNSGWSDFITTPTVDFDTSYIVGENICPRDYGKNIDTASWGACLCWENGGRRSNNGTSTRCTASFPVKSLITYDVSPVTQSQYSAQQVVTYGLNNDCTKYAFITKIDQNTNAPKKFSGFTLWPYRMGTSTTMPSEQDWCSAENSINNSNQVCPFGVGLKADKTCKDCPFDWTTQTLNDKTKCCPPGYTLGTSSTGEYTCTNTDSTDSVLATDTTDEIMTGEFPKSRTNVTINNN